MWPQEVPVDIQRRSKKIFLLPFWDQWLPPIRLPKLWGLCHLSNEILGGLCPKRGPKTSATLWAPYGEKSASPKEEGEISFYPICKGYYCGHLGSPSGQPPDAPRMVAGHVPEVRARSIQSPRSQRPYLLKDSSLSPIYPVPQSCPYSPLSTKSPHTILPSVRLPPLSTVLKIRDNLKSLIS